MQTRSEPCKIFVAGPRAISRLNEDMCMRLDSAIAQGHTFLVGDANGIDKAVQRYLAEKKYAHTIVYFSGTAIRNNLGGWSVKTVDVPKGVKGFDFYAAKDMEMAKDTDYGFMIWNGESRGTLNNLINLVNLGKKSWLYFTPHKKFYKISEQSQVEQILNACDHGAREALKKLEERGRPQQQITIF